MLNGIMTVTNAWISKAEANQRLGRVGRVAGGECFRLYTREKYDSFDKYPAPEILKAPLEKLIFTIKVSTCIEIFRFCLYQI